MVEGKISPETFEEWNRGAGSAELPERLHPKAVAKPKRRAKSKRVSKANVSSVEEGQPATQAAEWEVNAAASDPHPFIAPSCLRAIVIVTRDTHPFLMQYRCFAPLTRMRPCEIDGVEAAGSPMELVAMTSCTGPALMT